MMALRQEVVSAWYRGPGVGGGERREVKTEWRGRGSAGQVSWGAQSTWRSIAGDPAGGTWRKEAPPGHLTVIPAGHHL